MPLTFMRVAKVEEDVVLKFPEMSSATCGLVNPMPTKPSPVRRMTSVNWVPDCKVENIKEPVALEKFWLSIPVMAAVVVGRVWPLSSLALKDNLAPVEVALARFER